MKKLEGKVALVTGSSQGIGQGIVERFAQEGAKVIINYRDLDDPPKQTESQVTAAGGEFLSVQADVTKAAQVDAMVKQAVERFGHIDILVNNAGVEKHAQFVDVTEQDYDLVMNVNLKGAFFATQAVVRTMIDKEIAGRIINISSVHEDLPFPNFTAYCISKGGMKMMMRNLAIELAPHCITVNNIAPGAIETPINSKLLNDPPKLKALLCNIPLARLGQPRDVAGAAVFLASEDAAYVTCATLFVDGGLTWDYSEQ
ncbi:MAG: glucose 1-dehydrogenase [Acidobacteriaceae bacterium]|nr:glucose 1-dehydrogenase [Acidobacteriaceae bacterium]